MRLRAIAISVAMLVGGAVHAAEQHALLVGVSQYDNLPPYLHLRGPRNDVALIHNLLLERGVAADNVAVLADGIDGAARPTRAGIVGALASLSPSRGDFVFLYFAGHGSQQPAARDASTREPDGLDEIFLPADIGKWDRKIGSVANAITDDELGKHITRLRNLGAFVWAVFDSCHSGTMTRALPLSDERERNVDAHSVLGVPRDARTRSAGSLAPTSRSVDSDWLPSPGDVALADDAGGFVGFYASQSGETTPELRMPPDATASAYHGLFTYQLARILASGRGLTYRQAGQRILQSYAAWHRLRPTPLYEGTALDAPVFGTASAGEGPRQWSVRIGDEMLHVDAGRLHGLADDAVLALLPGPSALPDDALGYARVRRIGLTRSELTPLRYEGSRPVKIGKLPPTLFARLIETPVTATVRVAEPPPARGQHVQTYRAAARHARQSLDNVRWVAAGEPADVRLALRDGRVWLLPPSAHWAQDASGISVGLSGDSERAGAELADALHRMGRVIQLTRLSEHATGEAVDFELNLAVRQGDGALQRLPEGQVPAFAHGQRIVLELANTGSAPVDVTVLHVDSRYGLSVIYPLDVGNRIEPQGRDLVEAQVDATQTTGLERLLVFAVAAAPNAAPADFGFLAQQRLPRRESLRGGDGQFAQLVRDVVYGGEERRGLSFGRARSADLEGSLVTVRGWTVLSDASPNAEPPPGGEDDSNET